MTADSREGSTAQTPPDRGPEPGDELLFLPLGGSGEIGMNLNLYGLDGAWLMVDLGVTFGDDSTPGIDLIMPDPGFIEGQRERLAGLVLTHAHEDHIGAVPHLWERLRCPIYTTAFTASILRRKLKEAGLEEAARITEVALNGRVDIGPFGVEFVTLTHSIPEPNALILRTRFGSVLHTGDWKLDPDPLVGLAADGDTLKCLGGDGVLAMVCDSTNVFREGFSGSEGDLRESLGKLVARYKTGRIAVGCFASNIARLETMARVAGENGRSAVLVGRSLWTYSEAARENGYLADIPAFLTEYDAERIPREKQFLICTGSQGEPRAALARIASGDHPRVALSAGDVVVFSSRIIPGNEKSIARLQNLLIQKGVEVVTETDHFVHVSGHPARDELARMYEWVRPRIAVPVHGEPRHLCEQARLARACGVPEAVVVGNGDVLRLAPGPAGIVAQAPSGRLFLDGKRLIAAGSAMLKERRRLTYGGAAVATVVVDKKGRLRAEPRVAAPGLIEPEGGEGLRGAVEKAVGAAVESLPAAKAREDCEIAKAARHALRRKFFEECGHRPVTEVHVVRL